MIDRDEAAAALGTVTATRRRAGELRTYAQSGDILIGWGLAWLVGNVVAQVDATAARSAWAVGIAAAVVWTILRSRKRGDVRVFGTVAAGWGFIALTGAITHASPDAQTAIMSLFVGLSYVVLGLWTGMRFAWLGLAVAAVVAIGWFAMPHWLHLWLALGGGGALIVGGLWLRRA